MKQWIRWIILSVVLICGMEIGGTTQEVLALEADDEIIITEEESQLLQEQEVYYVGIRNLHSPTCSRNADGELEGLAIDVIEMIAEVSGIQIEYVEVDEESNYEELDFYFLGTESLKAFDWIESEVYYDIPLMYVEVPADSKDYVRENPIGTVDYYDLEESDLTGYMEGKSLVEYSDIQEVENAFNDGEISAMIITTASLNMIRSDLDSLNFYSTPLDSDVSLSLSFPQDYDSEKITIFNKIITSLDETEMEYALFTHASMEWEDATILNILEENPMILVCMIATIFLVSLFFGYRRRVALAKKVNYDSLTGLYSQCKFEEVMSKRLEYNADRCYSIVSLDIDNFKYINEIYGYEMGSYLLKELAGFVKSTMRSDAIISRSTGDNFLVFTEMVDLETHIGTRVREGSEFFGKMSSILGENYRFSFSIGIYEIDNRKLDSNYMIDCANIARIQGKNMTETTVHKYTSEMDRARKLNNEIVSEMEEAIPKREFVLYYQPKVELKTGEIVEAEALVRWRNKGTFLPPDTFIPLFEKNGFIMRLDYYIIETVCLFISQNRNVSLPKLSANISGMTVMRPNLVEEIMEILDRYGVKPCEMDLEITETAFVSGFDLAVEKIKKLRVLEFTISMDDFGAGISSLNRLKNIEIDTIKIDRGFIVDSMEDEKGQAIIRNVINMANDIEVDTIAEGIETEEQRAFLIDAGCKLGQGYLFAKPMSEEEFLRAVIQGQQE